MLLGNLGTTSTSKEKTCTCGFPLRSVSQYSSVNYIEKESVYNDKVLLEKIPCLKRYIDDGAGFIAGTKRKYIEFI